MNLLLHLDPIARLVSGQIGTCLIGGMIVLLLVELFVHLLRGSAARFVLWFSGMLALGVMPLIAIVWALHMAQGEAGHNAAITLPGSWAMYLFLGWLLIAGVFLARIAGGFWQICSLRRRASSLTLETLAPELRESLQRFLPGRRVKVLISNEIQSPTAIGLLSPAIVLPDWLINELSTAELQQVFLHELSHLRRWDDWSNLLQKLVKALFFFHPAVWWMEKQISLEREMACDEAVLSHTNNPRAYAETLVLLAEKSFVRRSVMLAQAAVSRVGQTSRRITRILRAGGERKSAPWKLIASTFAGILLVSLVSLEQMPQLIAFAPDQALAVSAPKTAGPPEIVKTAMVEAAFRQPAHRNASATLRSDSAVAMRAQAQLNAGVVPTRLDLMGGGLQPPSLKTKALAKGNSVDLQPCEFVVVLFTASPNSFDQPEVWQVQMWHIAVLRTKNPTPQESSPQKVI